VTLVELIVAAVVLAVGILGLSTTAVVVARMVQVSHLHMYVKARAEAEIESMLAAGSARLESGGWEEGGVAVTWEVRGEELKELLMIVRRQAGRFVVADTLATLVRAQ
jgi:Tfp pilus assembly protein PilV